MESFQNSVLDILPDAPQKGWSADFTASLKQRTHGDNVHELVEAKPHVAAMARDFAGDHLPPEALEVAEVAHLAELQRHYYLGKNIRRSLASSLEPMMTSITQEELHEDESHTALKYSLGLLSDFPIIANFSKSHEEKCRVKGRDYVDLKGLVGLVEKTNFESIIIKSALDYSNFLLLDSKPSLNDQEAAKMRRIITVIKTVDSPLLALTGFDALDAEILSKAYCWELQNAGNSLYVDVAESAFEELGGRQQLATTAEQFLENLFKGDEFVHDRVTADQHDYDVFFSDGTVSFGGKSDEKYRVLSRLKSVGATAKKMHSLHKKTGSFEVPMDIIGVTLIAKDKDQMANCLDGLFVRLSELDISFQSAPSRREQVHVKGRPDFLKMFGTKGTHSTHYVSRGLEVQDEPCDNGYEAVKITMMLDHEGTQVPMEIQITHETARKESRIGLGSHTIFKLMKLAESADDVSVTELSNEEKLDSFWRLSARKQKFDKISSEINGDSRDRALKLFCELQRQNELTLGDIALKS